MIRCFLAINLSLEAKDIIQRSMHAWQSMGAGIKWVRPENVHLTLKFLGDVEQENLNEISILLEGIGARFRPFTIILDRTGLFPGIKNPRVLWIGINGDMAALGRLKRDIEEGLQEYGFKSESKPFVPHITVGRVKKARPLPGQVAAFLNTYLENASTTVSRFHLIKSRLTPKGPIYTVLNSYPLAI